MWARARQLDRYSIYVAAPAVIRIAAARSREFKKLGAGLYEPVQRQGERMRMLRGEFAKRFWRSFKVAGRVTCGMLI